MKDESNESNESNESSGINVKADLAPVLTATPTGIKYIFNLLLGKKHVEAERMLKLADAQNTVDVKKILSGEATYDHSSQQLITTGTPSSQLLISERIRSEEVSNLIECSVQAAAYIEESKGSDEVGEVDGLEDFVNRWKSEAKLISSEAAQAIWGRVLAQEVNLPGSISLRTLDVIKNVSKVEASNFNEICKYVVFDKVVPDNTLEAPISNEVFSSVRDAGLISNFTPGMYRSTTWPKTQLSMSDASKLKVLYVQCGDLFVFIDEDGLSSSKLDAPSFCYWELTSAGRELYKVVRMNMVVEIGDVLKVLYRKDNDFLKLAKYTRYTSVEERVVDTDSIKEVPAS